LVVLRPGVLILELSSRRHYPRAVRAGPFYASAPSSKSETGHDFRRSFLASEIDRFSHELGTQQRRETVTLRGRRLSAISVARPSLRKSAAFARK
jgi:hypothetical protein